MIGFSSSFMSFEYVWSYLQNVFSLWSCTLDCLCRDGGLKREKVKDTFKEEQQKLYSKMLVGTQEDRSRSWGFSLEVDWVRDRPGRRWLSRQTSGDPSAGAAPPDCPLLDVNKTPSGFSSHCLSLARQVASPLWDIRPAHPFTATLE